MSLFYNTPEPTYSFIQNWRFIQNHFLTRSQAVARIADRTTKNCRGHVTFRSRDHSIAHMPFPIGSPWNQTSISNGFRDIQRQM